MSFSHGTKPTTSPLARRPQQRILRLKSLSELVSLEYSISNPSSSGARRIKRSSRSAEKDLPVKKSTTLFMLWPVSEVFIITPPGKDESRNRCSPGRWRKNHHYIKYMVTRRSTTVGDTNVVAGYYLALAAPVTLFPG